MKKIYTLLLLCFLSTAMIAQTRSINRFINHHKVQDHALAISVPGWMLDIVGFTANFIDDEDEEIKELIRLTDKIRRVRILVIEDNARVEKKAINNLISGLQKDNFEELITVKSEDANVKLMIREKRDRIKNITALIQEDDSIVFMTLSGNFKYEDLRKLKIWDEMNEEDLLSL